VSRRRLGLGAVALVSLVAVVVAVLVWRDRPQSAPSAAQPVAQPVPPHHSRPRVTRTVGRAEAPAMTTTSRRRATPASKTAGNSRCRPVPQQLVRLLRAGLALNAAANLAPARSVQARAPGRVYFVAARVHSAALHGSSPVGVWATSTLGRDAAVFSVNATARSLSDWRAGDRPGLTMKTAPAAAAARCLRDLEG
jgi:hypothetical protein